MIKFDESKTIASIQRAQARNLRIVAALQPKSVVGETVRQIVARLHRRAVAVTHVGRYRVSGKKGYRGGGTLRASHRIEIRETADAVTGRIFITHNSVNPITGRRAVDYGPFEHARGGEHAFYDRAIAEEGGPDQIVDQMRIAVNRIIKEAA